MQRYHHYAALGSLRYSLREGFSMQDLTRPLLVSLLSFALCSSPLYAFNTPLSDQAIREAYFLGQRHDGTYPRMLGKYIKNLPPPKSGPYISSVTFLTPFIQAVQYSDGFIGNYSAQQALLDHRDQEEFVEIYVDIQFTSTYGAFIPAPASWRSTSRPTFVPRPSDFWRDFHLQILDGDRALSPYDDHGHANYNCVDWYPCFMVGATLYFALPAEDFRSDTATIQVVPPEGDPVSVDFDLTRLR